MRFRYTSDTVFDTFPWPQFAMGGTGNLPVPSGYQPDGTRAAAESTMSRKLSEAGAIPRGTSRLPVPPQEAVARIRAVTDAARALRALRREIMAANGWSLRDLYRTLEIPGANKLRDAHTALDAVVRAAYGMTPDEDILAFLLKLNLDCAAREADGKPITPPGLPAFVPDPAAFVSEDCIQPAGYPPYEPPNPTPLRRPIPEQAAADAAHFYCAKEEGPPYGQK